MSGSPVVTVGGPASVNEGANYRLNLSASNLPAAVQNWTINWGDGNTQAVAGNPAFVDHVYDDGGPSAAFPTPTILATVTTVTNQTFSAAGETRFQAGNELDNTFGTGGVRVTATAGESDVTDVVAYPGGGYVTVGTSQLGEWEVRRYAADGSADTTFGTGGLATISFGNASDRARAATVDSLGRIVVVGKSQAGVSTHSEFGVARLTASGAADSTFGGSAGTGMLRTAFGILNGDDAAANDVAIQGDGKIVVVGNATVAFDTDFALARYDVGGNLDASFGVGGTSRSVIPASFDELTSVALRSDNAGNTTGIVAAGAKNGNDFAVALYTTGGSLDGSFGSGGVVTTDFGGFTERAQDVVVTGSTIVVAGDSSANNGRVALARYAFNGTLDTTFGTSGKVTTLTAPFGPTAASLGVQPDGKLVVGGTLRNTTTNSPAQPDDNKQGFGLFRFSAAGVADAGFGAGGAVYSHVGKASVSGLSGGHALVLDDGKILQAGTQPDDPTGFASNGPTDAVALRYGTPGGTDVLVENVAPTPSAHAAVTTVPGYAQPFTFAATDVSAADTAAGFAFLVDYGDGNSEFVFGNATTHTYANYSPIDFPYIVTVYSDDKDGGEGGPITFPVTVARTSLQSDPVYPGKTVLLVGGSSGNNTILVQNSSSGVVAVVDGVTSAVLNPGRVVVYGNDGNDTIQVSNAVKLPVELYGGTGDDSLRGASGNDILSGGDGADLIVGGQGRDFLIGDGPFNFAQGWSDRLVGDADDDILIGGYFIGSEDRASVKAVMDVWGDAAVSFASRVTQLETCLLVVDQGIFSTVFDDKVSDTLTGNNGQDWFFANVDPDYRDDITDLTSKDFVDFITLDMVA